MQKNLDSILHKRMNRKDFLKHVAVGVAVVTGAAGVVRMLRPQSQTSQKLVSSSAYGASAYGGRR